MRFVKIVLFVFAALALGAMILVGLFVAPIVYDAFRSANQRRALQNRSDFPQIATACIALARATNSEIIWPTNPVVPPLLRSLTPRYISASSNLVNMEFHGGFDHYGYRVRQSDTNAREWTISWYTEGGQWSLITISHD